MRVSFFHADNLFLFLNFISYRLLGPWRGCCYLVKTFSKHNVGCSEDLYLRSISVYKSVALVVLQFYTIVV